MSAISVDDVSDADAGEVDDDIGAVRVDGADVNAGEVTDLAVLTDGAEPDPAVVDDEPAGHDGGSRRGHGGPFR